MGSRNVKPVPKDGVLYSKSRISLRPFDLLLFSGGEFVSKFIKHIEAEKLERITGNPVEPGAFSHVGMVVTSEILDHELVVPGKIYIWESTMGGKLGDGIPNIEGKTFFGVQLRDFDAVVPVYDLSNDTRIATARLIANPLDVCSELEIKTKFTKIFNKYNGVMYDVNLMNEFGALFDGCRKIRDGIENIIGNDSWLFCSEHVATVYVDMGIFPRTVIPENVVPMDFVGYENDSIRKGGAPLVVSLPPTYMVSDVHAKDTSGTNAVHFGI